MKEVVHVDDAISMACRIHRVRAGLCWGREEAGGRKGGGGGFPCLGCSVGDHSCKRVQGKLTLLALAIHGEDILALHSTDQDR